MIDLEPNPRRRPRVNLAPLIDVVFLLLVFFMLAGSFIKPQAIGLAPPTADHAARSETPEEPLVLSIDLDGAVRLNGLNLELSQVGSEISGRVGNDTTRQIVVKAEASVPVQYLVAVMDEISAAGLSNIRLAASQAE